MGTIRAQQTDNAAEADAEFVANASDATGASNVNGLKAVVAANADSSRKVILALQRVELLLQRLIDQRDGGKLGVT